MRTWQRLLIVIGSLVLVDAHASTAQTLRVVMHSDIKVLDPIFTGAYITRNHGYMIYDTLFAMDAEGVIRPQMVESYTESADHLVYTLTLRDGLLWHDGTPVTSDDCIASIKRWAARDPVGQKLMSLVDRITAADDKTFMIKLNAKTGIVISALGKPSSNVPFMMPKRVAVTNPNTQISDFTGSGPFVFKRDEWKPGDKAVYVKFDKYKPRAEPASGLAGGKVVKVARVEWLAISDQQQAINGLLQGDIDVLEGVPHDLLPLVQSSNAVKLLTLNPLGNQYTIRLNHLQKPFDNPKVRQALMYAFNQTDFLQASIGDPKYYKLCKAYFICGTPLASSKGMEDLLESNFDKARQLLKEASYDGTPIVLLQPTDVAVLSNLAPVAKSLMEKAGFKVDLQAMDWQTLLVRRLRRGASEPGGGWHLFPSSLAAIDVMDPLMTGYMNASCENAWPGWPCDAELEKLRDAFARATDAGERRRIAEAAQVREREVVTHIPLGEWTASMAVRDNVDGFVTASVSVFWNVTKR